VQGAYRGAVAVGVTTTSLVTVDVRDARIVCVAVKNLDASQTLTVTLRARCHASDDFAERAVLRDLTDIPPSTQVCVDVDVGVLTELEVLGVASGAGLDAVVTIKPDNGRRP
jgi:hypothetical protein